MKPTYGVPVEEIQKGIKHGVRKINVDTDNRMAMTGAVRKLLFTSRPDKFDVARLDEARPRGDEAGLRRANDRPSAKRATPRKITPKSIGDFVSYYN